MSTDPTPLRAENARLRAALEDLERWSRAYPTDVFPEPTPDYYTRAAQVLEANGMTLDRLSAAAMRHVIKGVGETVRAALAGKDEG